MLTMWLIVWNAFPVGGGEGVGSRWVPHGAVERRPLPMADQHLEELITEVAALEPRGIASWAFYL